MDIIKPGRQFDFMSQRRLFGVLSLLFVVVSIIFCFKPGLRLGTDFTGGTEVEIAFVSPVPAGDVRAALEKGGFEGPEVIAVEDAASPNQYLIRVKEVSSLSEEQRNIIRDKLCFAPEDATVPEDRCPPAVRASEVKFSPAGEKISARYEVDPDLQGIKKQLEGLAGIDLRDGENPVLLSARDHKVEIHLKSRGDQLIDTLRQQIGTDKVPATALRVEWIGPKAGAQLRDAAIKSVVIALFFIMAYVAFRFDLRFAPGGILSLAHDVIIALGAMAITQREITLSTVAALLTIVGYSINDTVVVYDRIRENLTKHRNLSFLKIINLSVSEMLGRTIITSSVTAMSLIMFLWWGTGVLRDFAFALLVGMAAGMYSSIYIAAQLTEWIDRKFFKDGADRAKSVVRIKKVKRDDAVV
ncbi:MAG: protein translocase subunit SecF [Polyangiaceae bacterium]|nr:protein translocase subunit SecF [Polyangiaceae bacterium]NUQ75269.1 protein translocase subunit SecF [Polyangiaceae bacterium]